jgi:elongin-A
MPAPTLYNLAKTRLIQNITLLTDIGDLPYSFLAPILRHIQNPAQLALLETTCPQLLGETGEIWLRFIKRDIPNWEHKPHSPKDPKNWSKVYKKLVKEAEREKLEAQEQLKQQMAALNEKRSNKTQIIEGNVGVNHAARARARGSSSWGERSGAPAKTGKAAFDKLRRGMFDQKMARPKAALLPAHLLAQRRGMVKQAPERLVRMNEIEASARSMVVSKGAAVSVGARNPTLHTSEGPPFPKPIIRQRSAASPDAPPQRPHLPAGQQFSAPKIRPQAAAPQAGQKRRREEPNLFHQQKRRA